MSNAIAYDEASLARLRRRAKSLGIRGHVGGWIRLPTGKNIQGWFSLAVWINEVAKRFPLPANLQEIVDGKRYGIPTLCRDDAQELVAALLSQCPVSLRSKVLA